MTTPARPPHQDKAHWYYPDGVPCHTVIAKGNGKPRPCTVADARKLYLVPSVTNIIGSVLRKPGLEDWKTEQCVLACMTSPMRPGETPDAFIHRILHVERIQDQERNAAAKMGQSIHACLEALAGGHGAMIPPELTPFVAPAWEHILSLGAVRASEVVVTTTHYAGRVDLVLESEDWIIDYKSTKDLPAKGSWPEHRIQLAAYAAAYCPKGNTLKTGNLYLSTRQPGQFIFHENPPWTDDFDAFCHCLAIWQWQTGYNPSKPQDP